jgi:hypothetical protein
MIETQIFHPEKIQSSENYVQQTKILQDIIITLLSLIVSSFNTSQKHVY